LVHSLGIGGVALGTFIAALITERWMFPLYIWIRTDKKITFNVVPVLRHSFFILFPCLIISTLVHLFWKEGVGKHFFNVGIVIIYLIFLWKVITLELCNFIIEIFKKLKPKLTIK